MTTTRDELIAYLQSLPEHTEIEVMRAYCCGYSTCVERVPLELGENTELLDLRGNPFAKGKAYENSVTLTLGEED